MLRKTLAGALVALLVCETALSMEVPERRASNFQVLSVNPGLGGRRRAGNVFPVAVELEVLSIPVSGTISILAEGSAESSPEYITSFDLSPGTAYRHYLYPYCQNDGDAFTIRISDTRGRRLFEEQLSMRPHEADCYLIATIGAEGVAGLRYREPDKDLVGTALAPVQLDYMPPNACGWGSADAIIWPHPDPSGLSPAQTNALSEWVLAGGRLVVGVGDAWEAARKSFLAELLPGTVTGLATTEYLDHLGAFGKDRFDEGSEMVVAALSDVKGRRLVNADVRPLVVRHRVGFGEVIFLAFDPTKAPFARWRGAARFWDRLFALERPSADDDGEISAGRRSGRWYNAGVRSAMTRSLNTFPEVKPISFGFVVVFLVAYVILIGPVDYFVLRKLKHLEWTWFTFPAIAIAATLLAFWTISSRRQISIYINQIEVLDWSADGKAQRAADMAVLLSPVNERYDVSFDNPGSEMYLVEEDEFGRGMRMGIKASSRFALADSPERGPVARDLLIPVWSTRTFYGFARSFDRAAVPFSAVVEDSGSVLTGTITSNAEDVVDEIAVWHKSGVYRIGSLGPSQSAEIKPDGRIPLDKFYNGLKSHQRGSLRTGRPSRGDAYESAKFATLAFDPRYYPAPFSREAELGALGSDEACLYDLPPEWSLRSLVDDGLAVVVGFSTRTAAPLEVGAPNPSRWEKVLYRVCVEVE